MFVSLDYLSRPDVITGRDKQCSLLADGRGGSWEVLGMGNMLARGWRATRKR